MTFNVPDEQNFCRVFELPDQFSKDFVFGGGKTALFKEVDWFNPVPIGFGPSFDSWEDCRAGLIEFLSKKNYVRPGKTYLCITYFGEAFMFGVPLSR
jgi:hypothetical protein